MKARVEMASIEDVIDVADLTDPVERLQLADLLAEAGRDEEAALLRSDANVSIHEDTVIDADLRHYEYQEEGGHTEELDADDMDEAVEMARNLAQGGDWGHDGASVSVSVVETDETGEETDCRDITVEIEPDHEYLIRQATRHDDGRSCGNDPDDHDWTSEGEGGCTQNPGVWSTGGTSMLFASHCRACGLRRREMWCGSQRNPDDHDSTEYEMPDSWCAECQSEECECETDED